jgi:hypothetical protein
MIHEVDETLRQYVRRDAQLSSDVDVAFDAPTKDWASRRTGPVVDFYLYDIREDTRRREYGEIEERDGGGLVTKRIALPRWFKLSYLVTAWTQRPEDEHRLLSVLLACFLSRDGLPMDLLAGGLADAQAHVTYTCALPPPQDRALSDVWSALGGELKPSLDLVIIAPFDLSRYIPVGPPVDAPLAIDLMDTNDGGSDERRSASLDLPDGAGSDGSDGSDGAGHDGEKVEVGEVVDSAAAKRKTARHATPATGKRGGVTRKRRPG